MSLQEYPSESENERKGKREKETELEIVCVKVFADGLENWKALSIIKIRSDCGQFSKPSRNAIKLPVFGVFLLGITDARIACTMKAEKMNESRVFYCWNQENGGRFLELY